MISAQSMLQQGRLKPRYLARSEKEGALAIQLSGNDPVMLSEAVTIAEQNNPALIDLNCGCPQPKIRSKGCGSALMDSPKKFVEVLLAMRLATSLPLTIKIRTAGLSRDTKFVEFAKMVEQGGADAIIVHGRHHSEDYDVAANYQQIQQVVEAVDIPVIANGDVGDPLSLEKCINETGADAVMIARASIGKPWLFQQLLEGTETPTFLQRLVLFKEHIHNLALLENNSHIALIQGRRLLKWYFPEASPQKLSKCYTLNFLEEVISELKNAKME